MQLGELKLVTDGTKITGYNKDGGTLFEGASLRDATEAIEFLVLTMQYKNKIGYFNPDGTLNALVPNLDLKTKLEKIIATEEENKKYAR